MREPHLNTNEPTIDWQIFAPAFGVVVALSLSLIVFPIGAADFTQSATDWVTHNFGWLYMIMALGAPDGRAHPHLGNVAHAVGRVHGKVFLGLHSPLVRSLEKPIVAGGDGLVDGWLGEELTSQFFAGKLVGCKNTCFKSWTSLR